MTNVGVPASVAVPDDAVDYFVTGDVLAAPAHGTATFDGTLLIYSPDADYVGPDEVLYALANSGGSQGGEDKVTVNVGVVVGASGSRQRSGDLADPLRSLNFPAADGGAIAVTLGGAGTVALGFTDPAALAVDQAGDGILRSIDAPLGVDNVQLAGTTAASRLAFNADKAAAATFALSNVAAAPATPTAKLGSLIAPHAALGGVVRLNDLHTLRLGSIAANANIAIDSDIEGIEHPYPPLTARVTAISYANIDVDFAAVALVSDEIDNTYIAVGAARSWRIANLSDDHVSFYNPAGVDAVTVSGAITGTDISSMDSLDLAAGSCDGGQVESDHHLTLSVAGALIDNTIDASESLARLAAGSLSQSQIAAPSAGVIRVGGDADNDTFTFTDASLSIGELTVAGSLTSDSITAAGNVGLVSAAAFSNSQLTAGGVSVPPLPDEAPGSLGKGSIANLRVLSTAVGAFTGSTVVASRIENAALGEISDQVIQPIFGVVADSIGSLRLYTNGTPRRYSTAQLNTPLFFGDFLIQIV